MKVDAGIMGRYWGDVMHKQQLSNFAMITLAGLIFLTANRVDAVTYATLQPNAAGTLWRFTASWDDINGTGIDLNGTVTNGYNLESSIDGVTRTSPQVLFSRTAGPLPDTATDVHWNGTFSSRPTWNDIGAAYLDVNSSDFGFHFHSV